MSIENSSNGVSKHELSEDETGRLRDKDAWEKVKALLQSTPEEDERVLRESKWIDIDEVNKMLGITPEEIAETLNSPRE